MPVVCTFAAGARLTLGQVRVNGKRNEIAATPALPDINGMTVKADAMHTQQATAEAVAAGCRDDILPEFVKRHGRFLH